MYSIHRLMLLAVLLPVPAFAASAVFPSSLVGQWTDNPTNCGGEDTTGMMITPTTVSFYEAQGEASTISTTRDGTIMAKLAYRGEGRRWSETSRFTIARDGKTVKVVALGTTFDLKRCPMPQGT